MSQINNPLEIYKFLPKTNCRQCHLTTCLAFAAAVINGQKKLKDCPHLDNKIIEQLDVKIVKPVSIELQQESILEPLKKKVAAMDLFAAAERLGALFTDGKLKIKALGKDFVVDSELNITSECHINTWVTVPLLNYIIHCKGENITGEWVPFRELNDGQARDALFEKRCVQPLKQLIDNHTDLLEDMICVFGGKPVENPFSSDISLILYLLPKVPILINYSKPEDELASKLNIFFDKTADKNLNIESIHILGSGLVTMFEKISLRHR